MTDAELIRKLGGTSRVAELLGYKKVGGQQRVQNWVVRGIPAAVKLKWPSLFLDASIFSIEVVGETSFEVR